MSWDHGGRWLSRESQEVERQSLHWTGFSEHEEGEWSHGDGAVLGPRRPSSVPCSATLCDLGPITESFGASVHTPECEGNNSSVSTRL